MSGQKIVFDTLDEMKIPYEKVEHAPMFTMNDHPGGGFDPQAVISKNLFLRNAKGDVHYLVVEPLEDKADLKALAERLGSTRLSFGSPERLMKYLGVTPGSVSAFTVLNDKNAEVIVVFSSKLKNVKKFGLHPNENTATLYVDFGDVLKVVRAHGNEVIFLDTD